MSEVKELKTNTPYEMVNHPSHYNQYSKETLDILEDVYGVAARALWDEMTAFKYRMRMGTKPGSSFEQDFKKELFYLNDYHNHIDRNKEEIVCIIVEKGKADEIRKNYSKR